VEDDDDEDDDDDDLPESNLVLGNFKVTGSMTGGCDRIC